MWIRIICREFSDTSDADDPSPIHDAPAQNKRHISNCHKGNKGKRKQEENIEEHTSASKNKNKILKTKHRKQKFTKKWVSDPELSAWLSHDQNDEYRAKCIYCNYSMSSDIMVIKRHGKSIKHKEKMQAATVKQQSISRFTNKNQSISKATTSTEIKLVGFLTEHNLSFRLTDHFVDLLKNICPDYPVIQNIAMKRTKATNIAVHVIGASHKEKLAEILRNNKFSLLTDESTDISCIKTACVVVRYNDTNKKKIVSEFWELYKIYDSSNANEGATAENLFNGIIKCLENYSIPLSNIIGFAADGCSTMMGQHNSVASRFKEKCPNIFILKCVCHSAALCASEACKTLPRSIEDLARNIYNFFKLSAKRQCQFRQFQEFANVAPHKMLHPSQTRWLSLIMVIERIIEQWEALRLFFIDRWFIERLRAAEQISNELNNPGSKLYFFFLEWILPKFTDFNRFFQTDSVVITELHDKIVNMYQEILLCYMKRDYVMKTSLADINPCKEDEFIPISQIYLGVKVLQAMNDQNNNFQQNEKKDFFWRCREFLKISAQQISNRYDMQNPVLEKLKALHPKNALSLSYRDTTPTLLNLMKVIPRVLSCNDSNDMMQKIDDQWRRLPFSTAFLPKDLDKTHVDKFWNKILDNKNAAGKSEFHELATFALDILCLPHSNADCERIFSRVNLMKTKFRNKLKIETVNGSLLATECVKRSQGENSRGCAAATFQPTDKMLQKMTANVLYPKKRQENEQIEQEDSETEIIF
ncbi:protein FAM200A-like [Temnothorax nylanderi]|uniref:protein FAM200A-like n=1 Tax=Temnothorax nylanderi TaxID=102681 RepID=UPI003A86848C